MSQYVCMTFALLFALLSCSQSTPQMPQHSVEVLTEEEQMLKDLRQYPKNQTFVKQYEKVAANLKKLENQVPEVPEVPEVPAVPAGGFIVDPGVPVGVVDLDKNNQEAEAELQQRRDEENQKNAIIQTAIASQNQILKSMRFAQSGWTDLSNFTEEVRTNAGQSLQKENIDVAILSELTGSGGKIYRILEKANYFLDRIQDAENAQVKAEKDLAQALAISKDDENLNKTLKEVKDGISELELNVFALKKDGVTAIKTWTCNKAALAAMIPIGYVQDAMEHVKKLNGASIGPVFVKTIKDAVSRSYTIITAGTLTAESIANIETVISTAKSLAHDIQQKEQDLINFMQSSVVPAKPIVKAKNEHYLKLLHSAIAQVNSFLNEMKPAEEAFEKIKNS